MKQFSATVANLQSLTSNLDLLTLTSPDMPQMRAGQLLLARTPNRFDPYLRAMHFAIPSSDSCSIIVRRDVAVQRLYNVNDTLDVIAPVGNGFTLDASTRRLLLVGDEAHLAPLVALAHEATQKALACSLLVQTDDGQGTMGDDSRRVLESLLPIEVEYQVASHLDIASDLLRWCDQLCAAGSSELYARLKERVAQNFPTHTSNFAQVIVAPTMACGFGACRACAVETTRGMKLACVDGPVFDLFDGLLVG